MSSPGSPDSSSRKRKSPFDSPMSPPDPLNKRRRHSHLSLSKNYLERYSQSNDSSFKIEDEDSRSITSVSIASVSSEQVVSNYTEQEYTTIAAKFGINVTVAKRYYSYLTNQPKVAIIKVYPIKRELLTAAELEEAIATSPVLSAKKKGKKKLSKEGKGISGDNTDNGEALVDNEELIKRKLNKRVMENIHSYLQKSNNYNIEADIPPESFQKKGTSLSRYSESLAYDSENEIEELADRGSQKSLEKTDRSDNVLVNPFSKDGQVKTSTQISEKKNSQWKKFGSIQPQDRKKLILKTFAKKKGDSETDTVHESLNGIETGSEVTAHSSGTASKEVKNKKLNRKRKRIIAPDSDSESDVNSQTYDSLSVNCPLPFFGRNTNGDNGADHVQLYNGQAIPVEVFGKGVRNHDDDDDDEEEDIIDLSACSPESVEFIEEETPVTSKNLVNGFEKTAKEIVATSNHLPNGNQETVNAAAGPLDQLANGDDEALNENAAVVSLVNEEEADNLSDDLFDSPTKPESPSDRLVIDMTPRSSTEPEIINIGSSSSGDSPRPRGKPKIKSDTKLKTNYFNIPPRKTLQRQGKASPSSPSTKSDEIHTPSANGISNQLGSKTPSQQSKINSETPTTRGLRGLQQVKCNLNNEESLKEYQHAKSKTTNDNHVDESFDSICQDLKSLSNTDNITLYKGGESTESSSDKVVIPSKPDDKSLSKEESVPPAPLDDKPTESTTEAAAPETATEATKEDESVEKPPSSESPQSPQFNFKTAKSTPSKSTVAKTPIRLTRSSVTDSPACSPLLGFRIPRKDPPPPPNKCVTPPHNSRDPRLNRSLSPKKPQASVSPTSDARVTRSGTSLERPSGVSPADPRLTRGQSRPRSATPTPPTNISPSIAEKGEEIKIEVDPRLRKRREREAAERAAKLAQEQALLNPEQQQQQEPEKFGQSSSPGKKVGVFQRLGNKEQTTSPVRGFAQNEFIGIIKATKPKTPSPTKSVCETDDDNISLHPGISDFYDSSDEDDKDSSPRHRKFESERNRSQTTETSTTTTSNQARVPPQQRLSVKQRLGQKAGDLQALGNRITASKLAPPPPPPPPSAADAQLLSRQARFGLGVRPPPAPQQPLPKGLLFHNMSVPPPDFSVPPPLMVGPPPLMVGPPPTTPNSSFMSAFMLSNERQMMQDQSNILGDDDPIESPYMKFDSDQPNEYDYKSILDDKPNPQVKGLSDPKFTFFKKQCYRKLRNGRCNTELTTCQHQHSATSLAMSVKSKSPAFIKAILDTCIAENYDYFLDNVWKSALPLIKEDAFMYYEKLYMGNKRAIHFALDLLNQCMSQDMSVEEFLRKITPVIDENDSNTVQAICSAIKPKIHDRFYWETLRDICKKAAPSPDIVEVIMLHCLKDKKSSALIREVHEMVKTKMIATDRDKISTNTLKLFYDLVNKINASGKDREVLNTMPLNNVTNNLIMRQSFEQQSVNVPKAAVQPSKAAKTITANGTKHKKSMTPVSPDGTPFSSPNNYQAQAPVNGESRNSIKYAPKAVDATECKSLYRGKFWKLYRAADNVDIGLSHGDYKDVWEHLQKLIENEEEVTNQWSERAAYQILCRNIKTCAQHMEGVIKEAVSESSKRSTEVLFVVGIYALIDLSNNEYWEMALQLLKQLKVFEPQMPPIAYSFICAEIYLANNNPSAALSLLQRTKLIRTNRDEWLVKESEKADEKHRNKLVFILLQALAHLEPEKAVFLFKELIEDQYIYHYPIDLSRYVDKFTLLLLTHKRLDLVADIATLVMGNHMTWQKPTYQELLSHMLPVDDNLANQILDYAIHLGYYNDINIRQGYVTVIMDYKYTDEEMYLILKRLVRKLTENCGPTIPKLKLNSMKVTLIIEDVPTDKRLHENVTMTKKDYPKYITKNRQMRRRIANILATRFSPAIKLSQAKPDRFCRIMSRTLVEHLKHWH